MVLTIDKPNRNGGLRNQKDLTSSIKNDIGAQAGKVDGLKLRL
ncbi:MAG: hypothetical protein WCR20_01760 [Verrucomicrobiota bacterium]|jgi:hypothetical protein|nr:hypothetical protein [Verrucomicrobiota bacterium]